VESLSPREALFLAARHRLQGRTASAILLLERVAESPDREFVVRGLLDLALIRLEDEGDAAGAAGDLIERAAAVAGDNNVLGALVLHARGKVHWKAGESSQAGECLKRAQARLEDAGADQDLAKVLDSLAMYHELNGDCERSLSCYALSLMKKAISGDASGLAITLGNLGRFHLRRKEPAVALSFLREDLRMARALGDPRGQTIVKINMGQALTDLGRIDEARPLLDEALADARREGWKLQEACALKDLGLAAARRGKPDDALLLLLAALEALPEEGTFYVRGQIQLARGEIYYDLGELDRAREAFHAARQIFARLHCPREEGLAVHGLARIAEERSEGNSCIVLLEEGMSLLRAGDTQLLQSFRGIYQRLNLPSGHDACPRSIGPYRIVSRIGRGAFADVYRGFDGRQGASREDIAVKALRLDGVRDGDERAERTRRFLREHEILRRVSHPNVIRILDLGREPELYIVEEWIEGGDLKALIERRSRLPWQEALPLLVGLLRGLSALHALDVCHRDLKPGNVLLRTNGAPVIADFGLARMHGLTSMSIPAEVMGTLPYMPPEQLRGTPVDERADIYSLGVVAFQLLAGGLPYPGDSFQDFVANVRTASAPRIELLPREAPAALLRCILRCIEREPARRYPSAGAVLDDLAQLREISGGCEESSAVRRASWPGRGQAR
jgi:tetratricopeptide (TPR) repeat protein/tRNA A-37 threonylcarbamoyl transferase component Bud32